MAGIADDSDSVMEMMGEAAKRLHAKDPEHELLQYLKNMGDDEVYAAFVERFGKKGIPEHQRSNALNTTWMYAQYLVALRKELGELPATPTVPPEPNPYSPAVEKYDTPIPF